MNTFALFNSFNFFSFAIFNLSTGGIFSGTSKTTSWARGKNTFPLPDHSNVVSFTKNCFASLRKPSSLFLLPKPNNILPQSLK